MTSGGREPRLVEPAALESNRSTALRRALPLVGLWIVAATTLAVLTTRVRDWYAMPNELLNERRAISVAETLSPLPSLHHQVVASFDQLYPVLIAGAFRYGSILSDLRNAHALNAIVMTSACIPCFLLARRVGVGRPLAYLVSALSVCMPWMFFAALLMNEVVAYPVFAWATLAMHSAVTSPSRRNDALALVAVVAAFFSRTQLAMLAFAFPASIVVYELGRAGKRRPGPALRSAVGRHPLLGWVYAAAVAAALVAFATHRLHSVLGVYGGTISGNLLPHGIPRSLVWHLASMAIGLGILPVVVGLAWLLAAAVSPGEIGERHAFACVGAVTAVFLLFQVTVFDLRYVDGLVLDRYLIYLVPLVLVGFAGALSDPKPLRASIGLVTAAVAIGFAVGAIQAEPLQAINSDSPIASLYPPIVSSAKSLAGARILLVGTTILASVLFVLGRRLLSRRVFVVVFSAVPLVVIPYVTADLFVRFFHDQGWSMRQVTSSSGAQYSWVDQRVGRRAHVALIPYPVSTDYPVSERVFRDYEFWNKSVDRDVQLSPPPVFEFTNETFPKLHPRFDPVTGRSSVAGWPYVLESTQETRARISGTVLVQNDVMLIRANRPWRADWISSGLYDDGWTRPGAPVHVRVFARPAARRAEVRWLTFGLHALDDSRAHPVTIVSRGRRTRIAVGPDTSWTTVSVCVPRGRFADVELTTPVRSVIPGDQATLSDSQSTRIGGVFVSQISEADDIGGRCSP